MKNQLITKSFIHVFLIFFVSSIYIIGFFLSANAHSTTIPGSVDLVPGFNLLGLPVDPVVVPDAQALLPLIGNKDQIERVLRLNDSGSFDEASFFLHKVLMEGGNWSLLPPTAQALYPVITIYPPSRLHPSKRARFAEKTKEVE